MSGWPDQAQHRRAPSHGSNIITTVIFDFETYQSNAKQKTPAKTGAFEVYGGVDETRTRDLLRDRQAF